MKPALFDTVAHFYDVEVNELIGFKDDVPFYQEYAEKLGGEVLEIACGTGRVLIPIAGKGISITGLDASSNMLGQAREKISLLPEKVRKRIHLVHEDMTGFHFDTTFAMIFCAFRSFQHLLSKKEQGMCLSLVHSHLSADGLFILDLFVPFHNLLAQRRRTIYLGSFKSAKIGALVTRRSEVTYDLVHQTLHEDRFYEWTDNKGVFHRQIWSFDLAYLFRQEVELLLEKHGFEVLEVFSDFQKTPYDYYSGEQIFVSKRRG